MPKKKLTIKDVAHEAGVSTATVSLVLSGKGKISGKKKAIVINTINRIGYKRQRDNPQNKKVNRKYVGLIVFCDFPFQWWFASEFIHEIKSQLLEEKIYTLIFKCDHETDPQKLFDNVMNAGLNGVLALHFNDRDFFRKLQSQNMPFILINNSNFQTEFHTICSDDFQGAYEGTKKIISQGHKKILYIDYPRPLQPATIVDRYFGFRKAIEEADLSFSDKDRIHIPLENVQRLELAIKEYLVENKDVTAFFIHDDYYAVRVIETLKKIGIRVPDDISIIAPGDSLPYQEPFVPQITTMQIDRKKMGKISVEMLLTVMKDPEQPIQVIKTNEQYIDRGSCIELQRK